MKLTPNFEIPHDQKAVRSEARKLEWITIIYMLTVIVVIYVTMGSSQAMKAAWLEDLLSLIPPATFLITNVLVRRASDSRMPYGYHRAVNVGFVIGALALTVMGMFITYDSFMGLVKAEHPTISTMVLFDQEIWAGWPMIAALAWGVVPAVFIGRKKKKLARKLRDKQLFVEAKMNEADWMTGVAGILGILGIGLGFWWADSVVAIFIGLDVLHDGLSNTRRAFAGLMDEVPTVPDGSEAVDILNRIDDHLAAHPDVVQHEIRLREQGHCMFGEAFVVFESSDVSVTRLESLERELCELDWQVHDFHIIPRSHIADRNRGEDPPLGEFDSGNATGKSQASPAGSG